MKPTIFFSHSSLDREPIQLIKEKLQEATGNTLNIFMSSDGASIPFGKNWLKQIEDALDLCKLMFVWVTPNSSASNWIYFESGYAYSRGIKVVPIGFGGIKLENLPAPLNFLQGFNINSGESLNNIIAVINREFDLTFSNIFSDEFYLDQILKITDEDYPEILNYVDFFKFELYQRIKSDEETVTLNPNWLNEFKSKLEERGEKFTISGNELLGVGFKVYDYKKKDEHKAEIYIDPLAFNNLLEILSNADDIAYGEKHRKIAVGVFEKSNFKLPNDHYLISSRLLNTEVVFDTPLPNVLFKYRNILFRVNIWEDYNSKGRSRKLFKRLVILFDKYEKNEIPILPLFKLLLKQRIYTKDNIGVE